METRLKKLESRNSTNSSLPPSRDRQEVKKKTRSLRKKSKRKPGGQQGHKGTNLKYSTQIDTAVNHRADTCTHCRHDLSCEEGHLKERKQVWDIPPVTLEVTEHRRYQTQCPGCQEWTCSGEHLRSSVHRSIRVIFRPVFDDLLSWVSEILSKTM